MAKIYLKVWKVLVKIKLPPHSSINVATVSFSPDFFNMLLIPFKTTFTTCKINITVESMLVFEFYKNTRMHRTWLSLTARRLQKGGMNPSSTAYSTCSLLPETIKLLMAHASSFCVGKSACKTFRY